MSAGAYAVLQAWLAKRPASDQPAVFVNARGQPLTVNGVEWLLHQAGQAAGVADVTPHRLRHTFARQVTEAGMPITSLGKLLGHADLSTTQLYTAGADPELCAAFQQAMQRLDQARPPLPPPAATRPAAPPTPPEPLAPPLARAADGPDEAR